MEVDGKTGRRMVYLSQVANAHFAKLTRDKIPKAPIFTQKGVNKWEKKALSQAFKTAVKAGRRRRVSMFVRAYGADL